MQISRCKYVLVIAMAMYTIQTSAGNLSMCVLMRSYKLHKFDCFVYFNMPMFRNMKKIFSHDISTKQCLTLFGSNS